MVSHWISVWIYSATHCWWKSTVEWMNASNQVKLFNTINTDFTVFVLNKVECRRWIQPNVNMKNWLLFVVFVYHIKMQKLWLRLWFQTDRLYAMRSEQNFAEFHFMIQILCFLFFSFHCLSLCNPLTLDSEASHRIESAAS